METDNLNEAARWARVLFCLLACVSVVLLLALAGAASAHESGGPVVVHMTDAGFEPRSVEIGPGETVAFENVGSEAHWPASDDHPMHTGYPGFDPKKPIAPGEEWSFAFDKPGKWAYHDHMNPYLEGEVVVRAEDRGGDGILSSVSSFFSNLYGSVLSAFAGKEEPALNEAGTDRSDASTKEDGPEERVEKAREDLLALVRDEDPKVALVRLGEESEKDDALLRSCHPLVHEIGRAAFEKYGDFTEAMKYQDEVCNAGYLHGVIEARLSKSDDVFGDMRMMCRGYEPGSLAGSDCYHGLGHGTMFYSANDLPRSLEMCDAFGNPFKRSNCVAGVFMENFSADQKLHLSTYLKEDDPLYPCAEQADLHKALCYLYTPTYYLSLNKRDYAGALRLCGGAEAGFRQNCAFGVGRQTIKENLKDPGLVEAACTSGKPEQVAPCIRGMAALYLNNYGSSGRAETICEPLSPPNQRTCYDQAEELAPLLVVD